MPEVYRVSHDTASHTAVPRRVREGIYVQSTGQPGSSDRHQPRPRSRRTRRLQDDAGGDGTVSGHAAKTHDAA